MPRGGKRTGAGRPRKSAIARKTLENTVRDGDSVSYGWKDGNLVTTAATGEYGAYLLKSLMTRLSMETVHAMVMDQLESVIQAEAYSMTLDLKVVLSPELVQ